MKLLIYTTLQQILLLQQRLTDARLDVFNYKITWACIWGKIYPEKRSVCLSVCLWRSYNKVWEPFALKWQRHWTTPVPAIYFALCKESQQTPNKVRANNFPLKQTQPPPPLCRLTSTCMDLVDKTVQHYDKNKLLTYQDFVISHFSLSSKLKSSISRVKKEKMSMHLLHRREESLSESTPQLVYRGELLKSVYFVGERSYSPKKTVTLHPRRYKKKKPAIFHFLERQSSHLLTEGASINTHIIPRVLYSFPLRADAPSQNLLSERKIKYPTIIRARHRRARISQCRLYLFICVSRYLHVPGSDSFLPKSTSYGLGVGRQESNTPLIPPLYSREKIRSSVLRSMPPHKLRLTNSPES